MNLTPDHIDQYLRNELSSAEMEAFQSQMNIDPVLREQVLYEQAIQKGFSDLRKAELKGRLDAIQITTPWYGNWVVADGTMMKVVGSAVVATLIGVGSFFVFDGDVSKTDSQVKTVSGTIDHPEVAKKESFDFNEISGILSESLSVEQKSPLIITSKPIERVIEKTNTVVISEEKSDTFKPNVKVPQLIEPVLDQGLDVEEVSFAEEITRVEISNSPSSSIDIQTIDKKSETLKYKFFDGKLFLYGNFNNAPYEILEINTAKEKDVYLIFENQYYKLQSGDGVKPLEPIRNESLLKDLMIIRNNKQ